MALAYDESESGSTMELVGDNDWSSRLRVRPSITDAQCEHLRSLAGNVNADLLGEKIRYSHAECNCPGYNLQLCLVCGEKLCREHSSEAHCSRTLHNLLLDIVPVTVECRACCRKDMPLGNLDEIIRESVSLPTYANGLRGLNNAGNICFMNSVWQALSNTKDFRERMFKHSEIFLNAEPAIPKGTKSLVDTFVRLLTRLWTEDTLDSRPSNGNGGAIDPQDLFSLIKTCIPIFGDAAQHDAHEFLRFFSDNLHAEQAWITEGFGFSLLSEKCCLRCQTITRKVDPCLDISLDFPADTKISIGLDASKVPSFCRPLRLHDCLDHFSRVENLDKGNADACKTCIASGSVGSSSNTGSPEMVATKRLRLLDMPQVLVIHFKRFKWSYYASSIKITRYVQFPLRGLKLNEFRVKDHAGTEFAEGEDDGLVYDLASVVVHHGRAMGNGHYTNYSLNSLDRRWYHYNDTVVTPVDEEVVARAEAYILFYEKRKAVSQ